MTTLPFVLTLLSLSMGGMTVDLTNVSPTGAVTAETRDDTAGTASVDLILGDNPRLFEYVSRVA